MISEEANSAIQLIIPKINEDLIRTILLINDLFFLLKIWNLIRPKKFIQKCLVIIENYLRNRGVFSHLI